MSTCISRHGEYSSHDPDEDYICRLCAALDEDALITEVRQLRARLAAVKALIRDYRRALREDEGELISWNEHNLTRLYDAIDDALETDTTKEN